MHFEERVVQFISRHHLIHQGMRIVIGVSGGADSMALLAFLLQKRTEWGLNLAVCSVDHQLRGEQSRADMCYVAAYCRAHDVAFIGRTVDAALRARKEQQSIEVAARELRYQAFREAIAAFHADALALAHHGDDQVETMLMHQVRGSIGWQRVGIPIRRAFAGAVLIRPFLNETKKQIEAYCRQQRIEPRQDPSNDLDVHTRNRFRKYVLPFLKEENPKVHLKFQYESERLAEDEMYLLAQAKEWMAKAVLSQNEDQTAISIAMLLSSPPSLQRRIIHLILTYLYNGRHLKPLHQSIHIENLLQLIRSGKPSGLLNFPGGVVARLSYNRCEIGFEARSGEMSYTAELLIPGETLIPVGKFVATVISPISESATKRNQLLIDTARVDLPLHIRTWHPGDRMALEGRSGTQKIQRLFINEKIDRMKRACWPLLTDSTGAILWVPLLRRACALSSIAKTDNQADRVLLTFYPAVNFGRIQA